MKRILVFSISLALLFSGAIIFPVAAEDPPAEEEEKKIDPMRTCGDRAQQEAINNVQKENGLIMEEQSWGNNPQESQYRSEVTRLLKLEIENVRKAVKDIEAKHKELINLDRFSGLKNYQEIVLEDNPGSWRNGIFVNSKKVLAMHYGPNGELECLVLDSMERGVYNTSLWTRKVLKMYYPYIQTMELVTRKQHYNPDPETLEKTAPEVQLQAFRLVFSNLRSALYSMDMMIAAYYDKRNKRNEWQIDL